MKKILSVLLSLAMLCACIPLGGITVVAATSGTTGNCTWTLDRDGHLTISGTGAMESYYPFGGPWGHDITSVTIEEGVTTIGFLSFESCRQLTSVVIPDTVTNIDYGAFYGCESLTEIYVPDSVTNIANEVFCGCTSLASIRLPEHGMGIGVSAFSNTAYYNDPNNWKDEMLYIGAHLIDVQTSCTGDIVIPDGVLSIAGYAASRATITSVVIPGSVREIGTCAFSDSSTLKSVTIGDGVKTIGYEAFAFSNALQSIVIPDSVTIIEDDAFAWCAQLYSISLPNKAISIGENAFDNCGYYQRSYNWEGDALYIGQHLVATRESLSGDFAIREGTLSIGGSAFKERREVTAVIIPDSVEVIGKSTFADCDSLISITIPDNVTTIERSAFYCCDSLVSATISGSVTVIKDYVFAYCRSLTSVIIPDSIITIEDNAFYHCDSLTDVFYTGTKADKANITISFDNDDLLGATWHCAHSCLPGDVNDDGTVSLVDIALLQRYLNGWDVTVILDACDVNADKNINTIDFALFQRYLNGWDVELKWPVDLSTTENILAAAFALKSGDSLSEEVTLTGKVVNIENPYDDMFENITVNITVEGKTLKCYRMKGNGVENIKEGDTITVKGYITNYSGNVQFGQGCEMTKRVAGTASGPETDQDKILADAFSLAPGQSLPYQATLTGTITDITTEYSPQYKNLTVIIEVGDKTLKCYRLKGAGADTLKVGDVITVTGIIKNYQHSSGDCEVEFDQGCTFVFA